MNLKDFIFPILGAIIVGAMVHYYWPRIETKTEIHTVVQNHTITRTIERPDGSKETTINSTTSMAQDRQKKATIYKPNWHLSVATLSPIGLRLEPKYQIEVQRRILGPAYVGALLSTKHEVGLSIGLEF